MAKPFVSPVTTLDQARTQTEKLKALMPDGYDMNLVAETLLLLLKDAIDRRGPNWPVS